MLMAQTQTEVASINRLMILERMHQMEGWYVAVHDYGDYYTGAKTFVNELLSSGASSRSNARSMIVVRKPSLANAGICWLRC